MSTESITPIYRPPQDLESEIELANEFLVTIPGDRPINSGLAETITQKLNDQWELHEKMCVFGGLARVIETRNNETVELEMDFIQAEGVSRGFKIVRSGVHHKTWTTAFEFETPNISIIGEEPLWRQYYLLTAAPHAVAAAKDVAKIDKTEGLPDNAYGRLPYFSDSFAEILKGKSFANQNAKRQLETIRTHIGNVEDDCEAFGMPVSNLPVSLEGEKGYMFMHRNGNWQYVPLALGEGIDGWAYGITVASLRRLHEGRRITKPEHLIDPEAGFWLDIVPNSQDAVELKVRHDTHIYVPISGQRVSAQFGEFSLPPI